MAVRCPRKPKPLLAFWKCHPVHPEAFQPVKLKQRCKAETLMKCINLQRGASILIAVWFVYEPSEEQKGTRRRLRGVARRRGLCNGPYTHTFNNNAVSSSRMPMMKHFFLLLCAAANQRNRKGNTCERCNELMMTKRYLRFLAELINSCRAAAGLCDNQHLVVYQ